MSIRSRHAPGGEGRSTASSQRSTAQRILVDHLSDAGVVDIESLCRSYPDEADDLREAYSDWEFLALGADSYWGFGELSARRRLPEAKRAPDAAARVISDSRR